MYLKASKTILQNKRFWRAPQLYFRVHRDREFWLELWTAILTKCKLTIQNIIFFNLKPLSRESTARKEYFSYIKRVYIFSRKILKYFEILKKLIFFCIFLFLAFYKHFFNLAWIFNTF